jgi:hypothetical protein
VSSAFEVEEFPYFRLTILSFVATMLHPVFSLPRVSRGLEMKHSQKGLEYTRTMILKDYLNVSPWNGFALPGQPKPQVR